MQLAFVRTDDDNDGLDRGAFYSSNFTAQLEDEIGDIFHRIFEIESAILQVVGLFYIEKLIFCLGVRLQYGNSIKRG